MTPDPITTAREALERLWKARDLCHPDSMIMHYDSVMAAFDYAENLKAENERLKQTVLNDHQKLNEVHDEVDQRDRQIGLLISGIWSIAVKAGIANSDVTPDGPMALLLIEDVEAHLSELEKLKAERDEALCRLLSAGSEKPTAEDMDWAISLSASLRREEIAVEDSEITRLTSQLEQAEKVIIEYFSAKNAFDGLVGRGPIQEDEIETIRLNWVAAQRGASQWIKDRQAKGEG